jgi:hypothetical protein
MMMLWHAFLILGLRLFPPFFFLLVGLHCFFMYEYFYILIKKISLLRVFRLQKIFQKGTRLGRKGKRPAAIAVLLFGRAVYREEVHGSNA